MTDEKKQTRSDHIEKPNRTGAFPLSKRKGMEKNAGLTHVRPDLEGKPPTQRGTPPQPPKQPRPSNPQPNPPTDSGNTHTQSE